LLPFVALSHAFGQSGPTLVGSAYSLPPTVAVAPGQIVTLQVTGLKTILTNPVRASQTPLPTVLAGISLTLNQATRLGVASMPIPLISIQQTNRCDSSAATADCMVTSITGQIPFEISVVPLSGSPQTDITISENGTSSKGFAVNPSVSNIHVVTGCGSIVASCVTHADGSLVTAASPAQPGEVVVIYAYGLGQTNPAVPTGQPTPTSAPVVTNHIYLQFDFSPNAGPKFPSANPLQPPVNLPEFAGLTPGEVGLYQINVKLPDTFPAVQSCARPTAFWSVLSNLTIEISDNYGSYDAAPICVQPPQ
jgi:uncharacterized protein (TIGR03437 family)